MADKVSAPVEPSATAAASVPATAPSTAVGAADDSDPDFDDLDGVSIVYYSIVETYGVRCS